MAKRRRRTKPVDLTDPAFSVGDTIKHPTYGTGVVRDIDYQSADFYYFADFTGKHGDGTKVWLPKAKTEKVVEVVGHAA